MLEALHLHVGVICQQPWDQGNIHDLMAHRPRAAGSSQILMFHLQATGVIFTKITTEMTELDRGNSSIVVVVSPQSYVSCGI